MQPRALLVLAVVCLAATSVVRADCELKSRAFAGIVPREVSQADRDSLGLPDLRGVVVTQVVPGGTAAIAGLEIRDVLTRIGADAIADAPSLLSTLREYYAGDEVVVSGLRNGRHLELLVRFQGVPRDEGEGLDIEYTCFQAGGARLRAVVISPEGMKGKRLPAYLIVSALGSPRLMKSQAYDPGWDEAHSVARAGFRVLRFELRGAGDSEGEDFRTTGFMREVDDNLAALDYLAGRPDVDGARVFVHGHSTGGMTAALVASQRDLAGLITSCTIGRTFYERMLETLRFQAEAGGSTPSAIDKQLKEYLDLTTAIARGDSLSQITARNPELARYVNSNGRIMDDRNADYWREQLNLNMSEVYGSIAEPVLVVYAASDFLTQLACHQHIRDCLKAAGNQEVTLAVIPETDHRYAYASDMKESYDTYQTRNFTGNPELVRRLVEWLVARANPE